MCKPFLGKRSAQSIIVTIKNKLGQAEFVMSFFGMIEFVLLEFHALQLYRALTHRSAHVFPRVMCLCDAKTLPFK